MRYYGPCKGLPAGAAFFYFVVVVLSIISTSLPDWWWLWDSTSGRHEGLWSTCWAHYCVPANQYGSSCSSLLNAVRAFSVMTIILSFFAFVDCLMLFYCITKFFVVGLICGILAVWTSPHRTIFGATFRTGTLGRDGVGWGRPQRHSVYFSRSLPLHGH